VVGDQFSNNESRGRSNDPCFKQVTASWSETTIINPKLLFFFYQNQKERRAHNASKKIPQVLWILGLLFWMILYAKNGLFSA
jgi:hypothetical protein